MANAGAKVKELIEAIKEALDALLPAGPAPKPIPVRVKDRPRRR